jgi:hypothetical protein
MPPEDIFRMTMAVSGRYEIYFYRLAGRVIPEMYKKKTGLSFRIMNGR